jgi:3-dehydroquinate synthase
MQETIKIGFQTDKSINIVVGHGITSQIGDYVDLKRYSTIILLADSEAAKLYGDYIIRTLEKSGRQVLPVIIPSGEGSKSLSQLEKCYQLLAEHNIDRDGLLCALGGGVTGDLGGFLAGSYLRGIDYIQLPTTLLAQVDSSIGGKTGINFGGRKNIIGIFNQPEIIIADTAFLESLPPREMSSASAEIIKYGAAMDAELFEKLARRDKGEFSRDELPAIIARAATLKAQTVAIDETDRLDKRAILNFGHTVGHAIEAANSLRKIRHGEAVSIGMAAAARISGLLNTLVTDDIIRLENLLRLFNLPVSCPDLTPATLLEAMKADKKISGRQLKWVLLDGIGQGTTGNIVPGEIVRTVLEEICQ